MSVRWVNTSLLNEYRHNGGWRNWSVVIQCCDPGFLWDEVRRKGAKVERIFTLLLLSVEELGKRLLVRADVQTDGWDAVRSWSFLELATCFCLFVDIKGTAACRCFYLVLFLF